MRKIFHGFCRADGFCMRFPTVWKCCPKKMFLHLIFARVFSFKHFGWLQKTFLLIDLRPCFHFDDLLERCSIHLHYESNQSIEWMNRINEWKQWIEPMNRINESNQWIESLSRETRQEAVTIHIRWLSKPVLESHHIDLLLWIPNPPSVRVLYWDNLVCPIQVQKKFSFHFGFEICVKNPSWGRLEMAGGCLLLNLFVEPTRQIDYLELNKEIVVNEVWGVSLVFVDNFPLKILLKHFQNDPQIVTHTSKMTPENSMKNSLNRLFIE